VASLQEGQGIAERFVFAVVRGDMEVNRDQVSQNPEKPGIEAGNGRRDPQRAGATPGYASPVGLRDVLW